MPQRTAEEAEAALEAATEQVIEQGGTVVEDSLMDAAEMALDGASVKSMAERIKQARAEAYRPRGAWMGPRG